MKGIFFVAGESETNKSELAEKALNSLKEKGKKVAYFKPVGNEPTALYSLSVAKHMIVDDHADKLIDHVIDTYKALERENDFVVVEGTNLMTRDAVVEFRLNTIMAKHLCLPVVLVMREDMDTLESSDFITRILKKHHIDVLGMISSEKGLEFLLDEAQKYDTPI